MVIVKKIFVQISNYFDILPYAPEIYTPYSCKSFVKTLFFKFVNKRLLVYSEAYWYVTNYIQLLAIISKKEKYCTGTYYTYVHSIVHTYNIFSLFLTCCLFIIISLALCT